MPGLNYKTGVHVTGVFARPPEPRFYDGSTGRELTKCPTCLREQDPQFPHDANTPGCARMGRGHAAARAEAAHAAQLRQRRKDRKK